MITPNNAATADESHREPATSGWPVPFPLEASTMRRILPATLLLALTAGVTAPALADEKEAKATIDKAIQAMGGEEKLSAIKAFSAKGKGQITLDGNDLDFTFEMTTQGNDKYRSTYEVDAGGTKFEGGTVLDGEKGWRKQEGEVKKLGGKELALEKRNAYLDVVPILMVPLKGKDFKLESAADDKVGGMAVAVVRVTGPEGKDFTLYFDKVSWLPVKMSGPWRTRKGRRRSTRRPSRITRISRGSRCPPRRRSGVAGRSTSRSRGWCSSRSPRLNRGRLPSRSERGVLKAGSLSNRTQPHTAMLAPFP